MKLLVNTVTVDEGAFLNMPIVDTSLALCVMNIADFDAVKNKLLKLYGDVAVQTESGKRFSSRRRPTLPSGGITPPTRFA